MSILHFRYEMRLSFDSMVTDHHFRFRCLPMETEYQKVRNLEYAVEPAGKLGEVTDGFGNRVCAGEVLAPHDHLLLQVRGTVETLARKDRVRAGDAAIPVDCLLYTLSSDLTRPGEKLAGFYEKCRKDRVFEPEALMHRVYRCFSYVPGITRVDTTAEEALAGGRGVCQDYAQILIALCRMAGYAARYVVGFLPGEGATHAWTEVWRDGQWLGLDPTHDRAADQRYIKLSHGRDFTDCSVERGCFKGGAGQQQHIYIKVEEEDIW